MEMSRQHLEQNIKAQIEDNQSQELGSEAIEKQEGGNSRKRSNKKQQISNFIAKMYKIMEQKSNRHIVQWADNGTSILVKNKILFQNQTLPKYFKHKKFSSFVRQLNMYDFHKLRKDKETHMFKHKYFKMGGYELLHKIKRKSLEEEQNGKNQPQGQIQNNNDDVILKSTISIKSKGQKNMEDQIKCLINENNQLKANIAQINKQTMQLELSQVKKQEKLIKILSALTYFDIKNPIDNIEERYTLRDLQKHFLNEEQPLSFLEYARKLGFIYRKVYNELKES